MGHEKPEKSEKPEKQIIFLKSHEKSHDNFLKINKVMKVVMKKIYIYTVRLVQFFHLFSINCISFYYHCY